MRQLMLSFVVAGLVIFGAGCSRKSTPQDTRKYDPQLDGPPSVLATEADSRLLADQALVAEAVRRAAEPKSSEASGTPTPPTPPAETPATKPADTPKEEKPAETKPADTPKEEKPAEAPKVE